MRILIDLQACQTGSSRTRGIGRYSMALAQAMMRNGPSHEFWVVLNSQYVSAANDIRGVLADYLPQDRIRLFAAPSRIGSDSPQNHWRREATELSYEAFARTLRPDFHHFSSFIEGYNEDAVTSIGRLRSNALTAVTLYDLIPLLNSDLYLTSPTVSDWYRRKIMQLQQADLLLAISGSSRSEAIRAINAAPDQVINISSAVDATFRPIVVGDRREQTVRRSYGIDRKFVMYTGGIDHRKNMKGLIQAYAALPAALRQAHQLAIVCSIDDTARHLLAKIAVDAGLQEGEIVFTGYVPEEDLLALYNLCTLFVFPSIHEGFGLPALEAMACGAPTIGADNSSIPEVIGLPEALFDAHDRAAMTALIDRALTSETFRSRLSAHGLEQAKTFSWDKTARRALASMEERSKRKTATVAVAIAKSGPKPRLAFVSPLPPAQTGIADYSQELLPALARFYDIDVIADQPEISDPVLRANFQLKSVAWFTQNASRYNRIVYQFGNSDFHAHMFELLERFPGVVVLHDFYLGHLQIWREHHHALPGHIARTLVESHGPAALSTLLEEGPDAAAWERSMSGAVATNAAGIIVHSTFATRLLASIFAVAGADEVRVIPHLRALPDVRRPEARLALGLHKTDRLLCSFGGVTPTKRSIEIVDAFASSPLMNDPSWRLVFVGSNDAGDYGKRLIDRIGHHGLEDRVAITGFASAERYRCYLSAADGAVQLRSLSRGETSGATVDCLAFGVPLIVNAHGTMAELDPSHAVMLPDDFSQRELGDAMGRLASEPDTCLEIAGKGRRAIGGLHRPARIAEQYHAAIEAFQGNSQRRREEQLIGSVRTITSPIVPGIGDWVTFASNTAINLPQRRLPCFYVDISTLVQVDARSGIQRVVRSILRQFLRNEPAGYRVEPVYASFTDEWPVYRYARQFTAETLGYTEKDIVDDVIDPLSGDVFLGLDLCPHPVTHMRNSGYFDLLKARGVELHFVVYDILPISHPDLFESGIFEVFDGWLRSIVLLADGIVCISRSVAIEVRAWCDATPLPRSRPLAVTSFALGADLEESIPSKGLPANKDELAREMATRPSFLMVGTLEPRKGHSQILDAFELLWARKCDINLVIVGKKGWLADKLVDRMEKHESFGRRLWWLSSVSDEYLDTLYAHATALIAGSYGEGFGLPLIEGGRHGLPVIARDLPVFREVAAPSTTFFEGERTAEIADVVQTWLSRSRPTDVVPRKVASWSDSARELMDRVLGTDRVGSAGHSTEVSPPQPEPLAPSIPHDARRQAIEALAYTLWERAGRPDNQDDEYWIRAAEEVDAAAYKHDDLTPAMEAEPTTRTIR